MKSTMASAMALMVLLWSAPMAQAQAKVVFDLRVQPLADSLRAVGSQTNINLLFDPPLVAGKQAPALKAEVTADEALTRLLVGTGIKHEFLNETTIVLAKADAVASKSSKGGAASGAASGEPGNDDPKEGKKSSSQDFRVAQVDQGTAGPQAVGDDQNSEKKKKKEEGLSEIVVTGSRIPTAAGQQTVPVRIYTREDIANSGETTIGEFLSTLPDVSTYYANAGFQLGIPGAQTVQLHGLPLGTTLTLLDGRRLETVLSGFFDLSNIPLSAVGRLEILPVGASAIYGADALAGAVNTILRKDFNGFEANITWEHASDVDDPSANLALGKSWDRGSISLIGSYQQRGELLGTQREPLSLTHFPINATPSTLAALSSDICAPGTVYSTDGSNLPGFSSPEAGIPVGITGKPTIAQFAPTSGKPNLCNDYRYEDITPRSQREGALLSGRYEFAPSIELFTEVLLSHGHLSFQLFPQVYASSLFDGTVAANNPFNPFGEAVNVSFAYPGAKLPELQSTSLVRPLLGVRGSLFSDWHYEASAYSSRDQLHQTEPQVDVPGLIAALSSSNPATALNPFAGGAPGSAQLLSSLFPAADNFVDHYDDRLLGGQVLLRGPLLRLPAGALQAVIGGEYGEEKLASNISGATPSLLSRHTYALFSETRVPLLAGGEPTQRSERLTLTLAGRYDHSNDYGGKATGQGGVLWHASDTVSFTGSYGLSYRAPRLSEISGPQTITTGAVLGVPDALRGNQPITYPVTFVSGPNYTLKAETGDSLTLGLQYSSAALPGLRTSLTWYDLKINRFIGQETLNALFAYPNLFPGAVMRTPPTPQDQQLGFAGLITQVSDTYYNFGDLRVTGVDADLSYLIETRIGQLTPSLSIANVYRWQSALLPGAPVIDGVSRATNTSFGGGVGWSPRWKGTAALAWKGGPLSTSLAGRYISRYLDDQEFVPNTNEIGNSWIFDFNARYEIGKAFGTSKAWLANSYVAFGAVNLFNKTPPFSYNPFWYDIQQYDIRGRFLHLNVGLRL